MKDNITRDEFKQRLLELVSTWKLCKSQQSHDEKWPHWIDGCKPYVGTHAQHNQGYEERPGLLLSFPNICEYTVEVSDYLPEFVLAACKHYAEKLLKEGFSDFEL